jgi:hypothetical protein
MSLAFHPCPGLISQWRNYRAAPENGLEFRHQQRSVPTGISMALARHAPHHLIGIYTYGPNYTIYPTNIFRSLSGVCFFPDPETEKAISRPARNRIKPYIFKKINALTTTKIIGYHLCFACHAKKSRATHNIPQIPAF